MKNYPSQIYVVYWPQYQLISYFSFQALLPAIFQYQYLCISWNIGHYPRWKKYLTIMYIYDIELYHGWECYLYIWVCFPATRFILWNFLIIMVQLIHLISIHVDNGHSCTCISKFQTWLKGINIFKLFAILFVVYWLLCDWRKWEY